MGVLPGIGGMLVGAPLTFGVNHIGSVSASSGSTISFSADTPNEHPSRIIAAFISHEGTRTISSFTVDGVAANAHSHDSGNEVAGIYLRDFPTGTSASFVVTFSGTHSNNAHVDVYELVGVTQTGLNSAGSTKTSSNQFTQSGPAHFAGGMVLTLIVSTNSADMGGNLLPIGQGVQVLDEATINGNYRYQSHLWLPTTDDTVTHGLSNATFSTETAVLVVTLPPA